MPELGVVKTAPGPDAVELREVPPPEPAADEVVLEIQAVGVCGSDVHMWLGEQAWEIKCPLVLGHEYAGVVREVGAAVTGWTSGDRAVGETAARVDPENPYTRQGRYNLDPSRLGFGALVDGAMQRFLAVPQRILHRIPENLSFEKAALTEPCAVAYNAAVENSRIAPGERVLVLGPGPIGLLCAALAKLQGAEVAVAGLPADAVRLQVARGYGCEAIEGDPLEWAMAVDGQGADCVIDATGVSPALQTALACVRPAGWITKVGWGPQPLGFNLDPLVQKNVTLQGSFSHYFPLWERILRLLSTGALDLDPVIGGTWPLEGWHEAFSTMRRAEVVKSVLTPCA